MKLRTRAATALIFAGLLLCLPLAAQEEQGPMSLPPAQPEYPAPPPPSPSPSQTAPPKPAEPQHTSSAITKEPPAIPVEQVIAQFAEHETEFKAERDNFTYSQSFVFQTIDDSGEPDGEYRMDSDISYIPDGKRYETVTYAPPPTLQRVELTEQDFDDLKNIQPFVLTTADLPKYNVTYVGRQRLDELNTYVFDVAPKILEKKQRYFQGRIWVDDKDLEIVKVAGKAVPDILKGKNMNLSLPFETYRENIEGHFWFPTYTHGDNILDSGKNPIRVRMTVQYFDYKRFRTTIRLVPLGPVPQTHP